MLKELEKLISSAFKLDDEMVDLTTDEVKPSIFKLDGEMIDVTTDKGIEKIREKVAGAKSIVNSSLITQFLDKETLKSFSDELDAILEGAEQEYAEAHNKKEGENVAEQFEEDIRPVLLLTTEEASEVYDMVDAYIEDKILPKLSEDTTQEFVNSIRESLADFAAWCVNDDKVE